MIEEPATATYSGRRVRRRHAGTETNSSGTASRRAALTVSNGPAAGEEIPRGASRNSIHAGHLGKAAKRIAEHEGETTESARFAATDMLLLTIAAGPRWCH